MLAPKTPLNRRRTQLRIDTKNLSNDTLAPHITITPPVTPNKQCENDHFRIPRSPGSPFSLFSPRSPDTPESTNSTSLGFKDPFLPRITILDLFTQKQQGIECDEQRAEYQEESEYQSEARLSEQFEYQQEVVSDFDEPTNPPLPARQSLLDEKYKTLVLEPQWKRARDIRKVERRYRDARISARVTARREHEGLTAGFGSPGFSRPDSRCSSRLSGLSSSSSVPPEWDNELCNETLRDLKLVLGELEGNLVTVMCGRKWVLETVESEETMGSEEKPESEETRESEETLGSEEKPEFEGLKVPTFPVSPLETLETPETFENPGNPSNLTTSKTPRTFRALRFTSYKYISPPSRSPAFRVLRIPSSLARCRTSDTASVCSENYTSSVYSGTSIASLSTPPHLQTPQLPITPGTPGYPERQKPAGMTFDELGEAKIERAERFKRLVLEPRRLRKLRAIEDSWKEAIKTNTPIDVPVTPISPGLLVSPKAQNSLAAFAILNNLKKMTRSLDDEGLNGWDKLMEELTPPVSPCEMVCPTVYPKARRFCDEKEEKDKAEEEDEEEKKDVVEKEHDYGYYESAEVEEEEDDKYFGDYDQMGGMEVWQNGTEIDYDVYEGLEQEYEYEHDYQRDYDYDQDTIGNDREDYDHQEDGYDQDNGYDQGNGYDDEGSEHSESSAASKEEAHLDTEHGESEVEYREAEVGDGEAEAECEAETEQGEQKTEYKLYNQDDVRAERAGLWAMLRSASMNIIGI